MLCLVAATLITKRKEIEFSEGHTRPNRNITAANFVRGGSQLPFVVRQASSSAVPPTSSSRIRAKRIPN